MKAFVTLWPNGARNAPAFHAAAPVQAGYLCGGGRILQEVETTAGRARRGKRLVRYS